VETLDIQDQQDFGVARGYICPVRLIYAIQPLSFSVPDAVSPDELQEAYETKFHSLRQQLREKGVLLCGPLRL
jgi:hypothetical protein